MRRLDCRLVPAIAVVLMAVAPAGVARGDAAAYSLSARADAFGVQFVAKDAPVVSIGGGEIAFVTPASAQSALDALGTSSAFASAPYPGELIVSLPGTLNGVGAGQFPPAPPYPFYVASTYPTAPSARQATGPYVIEATSGQDSSDAQAHVGVSTAPPQIASASSTSAVKRDRSTGALSAEATADVASLAVEGILQIGHVQSTASAKTDPNRPDTVITNTSLTLEGITVAGVAVKLTEKGLVAGGSTVPVDASALAGALKSAGIQLRYVPAEKTATSVSSAFVEVSTEQTVPNVGPVGVTYVLGRVSAGAQPGNASANANNSSAAPDVANGAIGGAQSAVPDVGTTSASVPAGASGAGSASSPSLRLPARSQRTARTASSAPIPQPALWSLFLVLAGGALAALGGARGTGAWRGLYARLTESPAPRQ